MRQALLPDGKLRQELVGDNAVIHPECFWPVSELWISTYSRQPNLYTWELFLYQKNKFRTRVIYACKLGGCPGNSKVGRNNSFFPLLPMCLLLFPFTLERNVSSACKSRRCYILLLRCREAQAWPGRKNLSLPPFSSLTSRPGKRKYRDRRLGTERGDL